MLLTLYRFLTFVGAPFVRAYLFYRRLKGREDDLRFSERLGHPSLPRPQGRVIWCHAASVGEAASLLLLIEKLREIYISVSFVLTTGTVTAARMVESRLPSCAVHQYVPVDLVPAVNRFLDHWQPMLAVWIESELWPNTLTELRHRAIPAILLNARMSQKSFRHWSLARGFVKKLLSTFFLCLAQTEVDRKRFEALGAPSVKCVGNLKYVSSPLPFDAAELARLREETKDRPLWLMASTHPGEEALAIATHRELQAQYPSLLTVIAPRHPSRGDEVETLLRAEGQAFVRRSKGEKIEGLTQIYLADTMGEMGLFYALCPITAMGGSFSNIGGHNPIEPAQSGSAIVFGPFMDNFSEIEAEFLADRAAIKVDGPKTLVLAISRLLSKPDDCERLAQSAQLLAKWKRSILNKIILEMDPLFTCK